jgi:hypothetical protein
MDLHEFRTKPTWSVYEESLLRQGYDPYWDPELQAKITAAGITCCRCGRVPTYVGMTNATTALGFLTCGPDCGEWIWFVAPTLSTRP